MTLPASRNTTYAASSEVKSADLNDIQDQLITLHERATRVFNVQPGIGLTPAGFNEPIRDNYGIVGSLSTGAVYLAVPLGLKEGDILDSVVVDGLEADAGGEEFTLKLFENVLGTPQQIGDTITSGTTGTTATYTWDDTTNDSTNEIPYTVPSKGQLWLVIQFATTTSNGEAKVYNAQVTIQ